MSQKFPVQPPPPTHIVAKGSGNFTGLITNVVTEKTLTHGLWCFVATVAALYQLNQTSGSGQGLTPQYVPANVSAIVYVPFGETRHFVFKKQVGAQDGSYNLDRVADPYP